SISDENLYSLDLPDIHFHQLRNTYATILLKNSFNSKGVSHLLKKLFQKSGKISIMIIQK
ncbi:hypothetical protein, partial [Dorea hominis]|uniref:hypothetical protein n=1 Tax=Dorea hominis TaxID=2763040 RepID=UPI002ED013A5